MNINFKNIITTSVIFTLVGCASLEPLPTSKYPPDSDANARNFSVPKDVGRVYYSVGKVTGGMYEVDLKYPHNFYVNSAVVGRISPNETLVFDLRPGDYVFGFSTKAEGPEKTIAVKVLGGDVLAFRGDQRLGATGFGLIGAAANPGGPELLRVDRTALRQPINPVAPQNCPNTLCVIPLAAASGAANPPQGLKGADRLNDLDNLRKKGLITQQDYDAKKAIILKEM
jgi:hypothetical protein